LNEYFVYPSANQPAPTDSTAKFYDLGLFQLASNGTQSISPAGELWVEHSWTMLRRKQTPLQQTTVLYAHITEGPTASAAVAGSAFLGTTGGTVAAGSTIPVNAAKSTFTLPSAGTFLLATSFITSTGSIATATMTFGSNITALNSFQDDLSALSKANSTAYAVNLYVVTVVAGTGANNTVTISGLTNLVAGYADVIIAQVADGFTFTRGRVTTGVKALDERLARLEEMLRAEPKVFPPVYEPDGVLVRTDESKSFSKGESDMLERPPGVGARRFWGGG